VAYNPLVSFIKTLAKYGLEYFGKYYSSYRAFVYDVEDPENLQRLKLIIPTVSGDQVYNYWAFPKGVFSGEGYGSQVLPKKGDVVWVEFEGGCPEVPIWSHGHFGKNELPEDPDLKDKDCYWLITPAGNKIKLHDTKKLIHIENTEGSYQEINETGISLVSDKISLGTLDGSAEPAVLGDTAMELLNEFIEDIGNIGVITTSSGVTSTISTSPQWQPLVLKWKTKWKNFKSEKVTLD
jgi:hypothetical protein